MKYLLRIWYMSKRPAKNGHRSSNSLPDWSKSSYSWISSCSWIYRAVAGYLAKALIRSLIGQNPATAGLLGNRYDRYFWPKSCAIHINIFIYWGKLPLVLFVVTYMFVDGRATVWTLRSWLQKKATRLTTTIYTWLKTINTVISVLLLKRCLCISRMFILRQLIFVTIRLVFLVVC